MSALALALTMDVERPADEPATRALCGVRCLASDRGWRGTGAGGLVVIATPAGAAFWHVAIHAQNSKLPFASGTGPTLEAAEEECMHLLAMRLDAGRQIAEAYYDGTTVQALRETRGWL